MDAYLARRQTFDDGDDYFGYDDDRLVPFWYTRTGAIVKWVIFLSLLLLFLAYMTIGHIHARKRIRKGLPPLAYHRWLIPRRELARVDPRFAYPPQPAQAQTSTNYRPGYYQQYDPSYNMQNMPPPPPMYDPSAPRPPMYEAPPPQGATKMAPSQEYEAPPGPPPTAAAAAAAAPASAPAAPVVRNDTGSSNPFVRN